MPHVLATLKNVPFEDIRTILENDKTFHASHGMYLEHLWQNADRADEVLFLFRIEDLARTKKLIQELHSKALSENPEASLPEMIYLR